MILKNLDAYKCPNYGLIYENIGSAFVVKIIADVIFRKYIKI